MPTFQVVWVYRKYELEYRFRRSLVLIPEKWQIQARYAGRAFADAMNILGRSLANRAHRIDSTTRSFGVAFLLGCAFGLAKAVSGVPNTDTRFWENLQGVYNPRAVVGLEYARAKQRLMELAKRVVKVLIATIALTQGGFLLLKHTC